MVKSILMYADDMIIMSTTQDGLQKWLNELNEYCEKWKLNVNQKNQMHDFLKSTEYKKILSSQ